MTTAAFDDRHLDAIREVVVASAMIAEGVALPWALLDALGRLLRCDEVALVGLVRGTEAEWFRQTSRRRGRDPVSGAEEGPAPPAWQHLWSGTHGPPDDPGGVAGRLRDGPGRTDELLARLPVVADREPRLVCRRERGPDFSERERFDLRLLLPHIEGAYRRGELRRRTPELTDRQRELLELVGAGRTNRQIGRRLGISEGTVRTHLGNIYARLGVRSRTEAVTCVLAREHAGG